VRGSREERSTLARRLAGLSTVQACVPRSQGRARPLQRRVRQLSAAATLASRQGNAARCSCFNGRAACAMHSTPAAAAEPLMWPPGLHAASARGFACWRCVRPRQADMEVAAHWYGGSDWALVFVWGDAHSDAVCSRCVLVRIPSSRMRDCANRSHAGDCRTDRLQVGAEKPGALDVQSWAFRVRACSRDLA
jgi:hypothetical protein